MFPTKAAQVWGERLERFEHLDFNVRQFCLNEGVSQASFYYWRTKLRPNKQASDTRHFKPLAKFIPVSLNAQESESKNSVVTVELPGGIRIRFEVPADNHAAHSQARSS